MDKIIKNVDKFLTNNKNKIFSAYANGWPLYLSAGMMILSYLPILGSVWRVIPLALYLIPITACTANLFEQKITLEGCLKTRKRFNNALEDKIISDYHALSEIMIDLKFNLATNARIKIEKLLSDNLDIVNAIKETRNVIDQA